MCNRACSVVLGLVLSLLFAACQPQTPPPQAIVSTPVNDLPISVSGQVRADEQATVLPQGVIDAADAEYLLMSSIYDRTTPAVVNIEVQLTGSASVFDDVSRGSGFVYDMQGHIITNAHVIKDAVQILVTFNDGFVAEADLVGMDSYSDLGVIRVDVPLDRLSPLALADSDTVRVGQRAIAIGNPFGLSSSMSQGIVSGLGRTLRSAELIDMEAAPGFQNPAIIQTDTPINPGNSGGPLLNSQGEVIGVTTAIRTESGVFEGVGFAVPANTVRRVVPELVDKGAVDYAWMGISVMPEENGFGVAGLSDVLELPVTSGVLIRGVTVDSPADQAGLLGGREIISVRGQPVCVGGDIIVAVNDEYVANMDELVAYLVMNVAPEDTVNLLVVRGRDTFELPMTLQSRPTDGSGLVRDCEG